MTILLNDQDSPRIIKLVQAIREHFLLLVVLQKRIPLSQPIILIQHPLEQLDHISLVKRTSQQDPLKLYSYDLPSSRR